MFRSVDDTRIVAELEHSEYSRKDWEGEEDGESL
jgi:hypothetical protein